MILFGTVQSIHGGLCPNISTLRAHAAGLSTALTHHKRTRQVNVIFLAKQQVAGSTSEKPRARGHYFKKVEKERGLQGVYRLGSWRLIECLEDKLCDIRYPSG